MKFVNMKMSNKWKWIALFVTTWAIAIVMSRSETPVEHYGLLATGGCIFAISLVWVLMLEAFWQDDDY